ncbi:hypothetical protein Clacol_010142 [Clathrus columnatus]|uniref:Uncharacterized protein n=1 Tax=Clathrus columnatus TaxID=1419009 RepID=A0AAV5ASY5_9AGAM|nr:hypothetical protein Clacol_010142 [Clathrus columnatus]
MGETMWKSFNVVLFVAFCSNLYIYVRQMSMSPVYSEVRQPLAMETSMSSAHSKAYSPPAMETWPISSLSTRATDEKPNPSGVKNITFTNPRASEFYVDGTSIPEVSFDVGPSWAGLLPISSDPDETRKVVQVYRTNGGPGCSALEGLLQENGPFAWPPGIAAPVINKHSWTNLSSVLWIEQPVGTGFSQGKPNIEDEDDLAAQLVGFLQQFLEVFSELKGKNFYLSGESVSCFFLSPPLVTSNVMSLFFTTTPGTNRRFSDIANYIFENPGVVDLNVKGIWINNLDDVQSSPPYFARMDVKKAIHAPLHVKWRKCGMNVVFLHYDKSLPSSFTVLPNVIEKSERTVIVHGLLDFRFFAEGTRIAIQNMTWNGLQGFQTPIPNENFIVDGIGSLGNMHTERGLSYIEVNLSGHMVPKDQPQAAFQIMQYLLGFSTSPA